MPVARSAALLTDSDHAYTPAHTARPTPSLTRLLTTLPMRLARQALATRTVSGEPACAR
ncbi:E4 (fragment) [Xanthomonas citri pv. citri]